ncbi:non-homologous end-joining DNA ligase [Thermoactinomyces mirandus]|uniref:DNA polymerase domain-containing protein n=1 Tax=Thermoactinomyces mirandus TaxID=2756294 RepID=A0A7W2AR46_9BACL|nr:non-homologous end-joining DNA ligase [Thermoactinomyces mirandus]MBA4602599.1 DNA polymerase domain-containing protein [Thermoactinomyces mirandus]
MAEKERYVQIEGAEIKISNPEKVWFPEAGIRKWDFVLYCTRLAPYLLPYVKDRYLTTIRFPDGVNGESFYQKNAPSFRPDWVETRKEGNIEYILLNNVPTLIWLANLACLEFHISFHSAQKPVPTELVFDLDPTVSGFGKVVETAWLIKNVLDRLELKSVIKTSGATGLQIYVPIEPVYPYEQTRTIGEFVAHYLAEQHPKLVTVERQVKKRGDKVYIDYLQHWRSKTLIAPYSPRAVPEATISTPLEWSEVNENLSPKQWTFFTIFDRLKEKGDLFQPVLSPDRQRLDPILSFIKKHKM